VSGNFAETRPSFRLTPAGRGHRSLLMVLVRLSGHALPKHCPQWGRLPYTVRSREGKMETPVNVEV
jgi:hypothetical protein